METMQLKNIIEAALLAASRPMTVPQLEALFAADGDDPVGHRDIAEALEALAEDCDGRGIELVEVASGFRYQVRQDVHPWVARMWTERPSRYSRALLETLALIAYRQPITRGEIEQVRGVTVSSNIIKTLEEREWIRVVGHRDTPGHPALFGTTRTFLDYFNLKSLDELPPLADIINLEALDPQLTLAAAEDGDAAETSSDAPAADDASGADAAEGVEDAVASTPAQAPADATDTDASLDEHATETGDTPGGHVDGSEAPPFPASPSSAASRPGTDADATAADTAAEPEHPEENRA